MAQQHHQFVQAFQLGEEKAFDFFFREYYTALCFFAGKYLLDADDAKDIVQECFTKLWSQHTVMENPNAIKSFLYTTVRNACINALDKQKRTERAKTELEFTGESWEEEELDEVIQAEVMRDIYEAMKMLPPKMQQVFRMYYIDGKNYSEIAGDLNTSPETVRKQRARALSLLKGKILFLATVLFFL